MEHLYLCKWNKEKTLTEYQNIFGENLRKMNNVYTQFKSKYENREKHKNMENHPRDQRIVSACALSLQNLYIAFHKTHNFAKLNPCLN